MFYQILSLGFGTICQVAVLQEHASNSLGSEEFDGPSVDEDILTKALLVRNSNSMITSLGHEALYLQCSKLNHSCVPNTRCFFVLFFLDSTDSQSVRIAFVC